MLARLLSLVGWLRWLVRRRTAPLGTAVRLGGIAPQPEPGADGPAHTDGHPEWARKAVADPRFTSPHHHSGVRPPQAAPTTVAVDRLDESPADSAAPGPMVGARPIYRPQSIAAWRSAGERPVAAQPHADLPAVEGQHQVEPQLPGGWPGAADAGETDTALPAARYQGRALGAIQSSAPATDGHAVAEADQVSGPDRPTTQHQVEPHPPGNRPGTADPREGARRPDTGLPAARHGSSAPESSMPAEPDMLALDGPKTEPRRDRAPDLVQFPSLERRKPHEIYEIAEDGSPAGSPGRVLPWLLAQCEGADAFSPALARPSGTRVPPSIVDFSDPGREQPDRAAVAKADRMARPADQHGGAPEWSESGGRSPWPALAGEPASAPASAWPELLDDTPLWAVADVARADLGRIERLQREQEGQPWNA